MPKFYLWVLLILMSGCNPNEPRYKGAPIQEAKQPHPTSTNAPSLLENQVGVPAQQKEARSHTDEVGPNAALSMNKKQFQFGTSAGKNTATPQPFSDAAGDVLEKPNGPFSEHQVYPSSRPKT